MHSCIFSYIYLLYYANEKDQLRAREGGPVDRIYFSSPQLAITTLALTLPDSEPKASIFLTMSILKRGINQFEVLKKKDRPATYP